MKVDNKKGVGSVAASYGCILTAKMVAAFYWCKLTTKRVVVANGCKLITKGMAAKCWPLMGVS